MALPKAATATAETEDEELETEEEADGAEVDPNEETEEAESDESEESDPNAGEEDSEDGEGAGEDEAESDEEEGSEAEPDPRDVEIATLTKRLNDLEKKNDAPQQERQPKELTEDEWVARETETGLDRKSIKHFNSQLVGVAQYLTDQFNARLAKFEKDSALTNLASEQGFKDVSKYKEGIDEFLQGFDPGQHNNAKVLKMAYFYAKGKGSSASVQRASNSTERHKKIALNRPAAPSNKGSKRVVRLTPTEESARKMSGMSVGEYTKWQSKNK